MCRRCDHTSKCKFAEWIKIIVCASPATHSTNGKHRRKKKCKTTHLNGHDDAEKRTQNWEKTVCGLHPKSSCFFFGIANSLGSSHVMVTWWFHSEINISLECIYCCFANHICTVWNFIHSQRTKAWRIFLKYFCSFIRSLTLWWKRHGKKKWKSKVLSGGINKISPSLKTIAHIRMLTTRIITAIKLAFKLPIHKEVETTKKSDKIESTPIRWCYW